MQALQGDPRRPGETKPYKAPAPTASNADMVIAHAVLLGCCHDSSGQLRPLLTCCPNVTGDDCRQRLRRSRHAFEGAHYMTAYCLYRTR